MLENKKISRGDIIRVSIDSIGFGGLELDDIITSQYLLEMVYQGRKLTVWC